MHRIFKTLLLWLLAVVLPVQAAAAVVKASCGSAHHAAQTQGTDSRHANSAHAHHRTQMQMHGHPMPADDASVHAHKSDIDFSTDETADAAMDADQAEQAHSTCSACAACCVGAAAPPAAAIKTLEPDFLERFIPVLSSRLAGYIPPSLERPPRSILV